MSKETDQLVASMKRLISTSEWIDFEEHIKTNIISAHKEFSVNASAIGKNIDATRQANIVEGLLEAIEEPKNIIDTNEMNPIQKLCHVCGKLFEK